MIHPIDHSPLFPESTTIGVLGSGQLGRMFAIAARRLGYRICVYSPDSETPAGQVSDAEFVGSYHDEDMLFDFAKCVDVVTVEFENIPSDSLLILEKHVPVRPGSHVLHTTQNRIREKTTLADAGFPVAHFSHIRSLAELQQLADEQLPGILKTACWGYDGKGQTRIDTPAETESAWRAMACDDAILESFVDFECEISVVAARSTVGDIACYAPIKNEHRNHVLDVSMSPAGLPANVAHDAMQLAEAILRELNVVGVMCIEMFLTRDHQLVVNELAPRPHNSGHLTIDAHVTCQFEQQVRAVCGLPLGSTAQVRPAAMANLLGEHWHPNSPDWSRLLKMADLKLHLYGKQTAKPGRKMGHVTALADTPEEARSRALAARRSIHPDAQVEQDCDINGRQLCRQTSTARRNPANRVEEVCECSGRG